MQYVSAIQTDFYFPAHSKSLQVFEARISKWKYATLDVFLYNVYIRIIDNLAWTISVNPILRINVDNMERRKWIKIQTLFFSTVRWQRPSSGLTLLLLHPGRRYNNPDNTESRNNPVQTWFKRIPLAGMTEREKDRARNVTILAYQPLWSAIKNRLTRGIEVLSFPWQSGRVIRLLKYTGTSCEASLSNVCLASVISVAPN